MSRRSTAPFLTAALCALALVACGGADEEAAAPEFGSIALDDLGSCGKVPANPNFRCGHIEVPFERADASYGTTRIGFAVKPRQDIESPSEGAFFMVEGGPGYASTGTSAAFLAVMKPLLENREMVMIDQRGQGSSERYDCPDVQAGAGPEHLTLAECARRLGKQFISYRTSAAADDIDWVRQALGYEQVTLYGDSYGTFLGQSYAYRHPDRLEALVLDSAYPAYGEDPWYPSLPKTGVKALGIACERDPDCEGDAIKRLEGGVELLRDDRRSLSPLIDVLIDAAYGPPGTYRAIDEAMAALIDGDRAPYEELTAEGRAGIKNADRYQRAGELVVGCNDYPMVWDPVASEAERRVQLEEAIQGYGNTAALKPFTPREIAIAPGTSYLECLTWPAPTEPYEPAVDPETQEPTDAPVLVVSGELDDVTTPWEGGVVADRFPDSRHFIARNAGHVDALYYPNGSAAKRIRAFLSRVLEIR